MHEQDGFFRSGGACAELGGTGFPTSQFTNDTSGYSKGSLTGSAVTVSGSSTKIYKGYYYDVKGRVTKVVQNNLLGGYDVTNTVYTFTGQPATVTHSHTASGKSTRTEVYTYSYDHADRVSKVEHTLGGTKITLADYTYDSFGRLSTKSLHGSAANKLTYAYNLRSWLTGITSTRFTQNLYYNTGVGTARYNGNISSMTWKSGNESTVRGYKFTYDGLDRMLNATYGETAGISTNANRFSENVTGYVSTIDGAYEQGKQMKSALEKAGVQYETLMTAPRTDMGDSIQKAFRNVDDILNDLGVEATEENRRAVRILGYNGIEITEDSIIQMKAADEEVQRMFKNMTPAVVTQLIKQGINPLEMKISDLNRVAERVRSEVGKDDNQKFSEYLYKMEKNNQITEEERNSYIGIYRLIHQVEQTDGAAIGALVNQGAEMTMKNLLTAVRSSHKTNRMDISVDNDYGESKEQTVNANSITDQIETAYQTNCMKDAADLLTPGRLQQVFDQHPDWQNMTPEEFAHALAETVDTDAAAEREYLQEQMRMVQEAAAAPDEIYRMLEQFDLPNSAMNVNAIQSMMANRNQLFRQIFGEESTNPDREKKITAEDIEAIKESIIEDFGEAVSEPKALAEVQETLGKVAENVMKTMISSDEVTSIDVREMRLMQAKLSINQTLAKKEQYSIPVLVGDKVTNVSLKIVRGVETKGIVDIMLESEMSGKIAATFQAKEEGISGLVVTDKQETRDLLADQMGFLASAIQESDGEQVDLRFAIEKNLDLNHFSGVASGKSGNVTFVNDSAASTKEAVDKEGQSTEGKKEDSVYKVQTARLYHIAEAFLKTIREFE